ncbi:MAG: hypothetical protein DHS20C14_08870 [Phycisphaeraceae bacterium]|nr:MAG: hypothetical protein DHS20C14_08870 [Phycisphaeraceae bacterium]
MHVRKNVLLTLWLLFPITVVGVLMWAIFASLGSPRAMDVPAVGPGAGDTGGANALGEWLAGNDPNAVDPALWPGGVEIHLPLESLAAAGWPEHDVPTLAPLGAEAAHIWTPFVREGAYVFVLKPYDVRSADRFVLRAGAEHAHEFELPRTNPGRTAHTEPVVVVIEFP